MRSSTATILFAFFGMTLAAPTPNAKPTYTLRGREVPQEHSHNKFLDSVRTSLNLNNPNNIQDPVFGLLGNAAAVVGCGTITNTDCCHQATADQAFTNAKAAGNATAQGDALLFAALERNTGAVGTASVICNQTAVNPEVAAIQQHQDPASTGAAATNKAVVLALAKQLAALGLNPMQALESGTFAPGTIGDPTAAGKTCDTADDVEGCIFSQNLLVNDATAAEITAAVAGVSASTSSNSTVSSSSSASTSSCAIVTMTVSCFQTPYILTRVDLGIAHSGLLSEETQWPQGASGCRSLPNRVRPKSTLVKVYDIVTLNLLLTFFSDDCRCS